MKKSVAQLFEGIGELSIYEDYSGRGMYGAKTVGVVGSHEDWYRALAEIMRVADEITEEERHDIAEAIESIRIDNMGLDLIYY